jgi:hypothetical protein
MSLPLELQNIIISFCPHSRNLTVCKEWNAEIKNIQKNSVKTIESWYKKYILNNHSNYTSVEDMVRYYVIHYPEYLFMKYPEFIVIKLELTEELLTVLPTIETRKRSHVRDWMLSLPIDLNDWIYAGW